MIAVLPEYHLAFVGVPKCLTTSILLTFYEKRFGKTYDAMDHDGSFVHGFWKKLGTEAGLTHEPPSLDLLAGTDFFTVVRDPVERLISAYADKVADLDLISETWDIPDWHDIFGDRAVGLKRHPDPDFFFIHLARYRDLFNVIRHHTDPISVSLGDDLSLYDQLFHANNARAVDDYLSARFEAPVTLPVTQRSKTKLRFQDLSLRARRTVRAFTRHDYALLRAHYTAPSLFADMGLLQWRAS